MDGILPAPSQLHESVRALSPKPGVRVKVIGAGQWRAIVKKLNLGPAKCTLSGLPRTGTSSFCAAVSYLLDGPAYHVGFQTTATSNPNSFLNWIEVMKLRLAGQNPSRLLNIIDRELDGFAVVADAPSSQLIPELMELYPDAKVVCTTRDLGEWTKSMAIVTKIAKPGQLQFFFFWIRSLRHFPVFMRLITRIFVAVYGVGIGNEEDCKFMWTTHHRWLTTLVPENKLFFVDVKDGWEPLCKALEVPVPKDVPFPRINDTKTLQGAFARWLWQGFMIWAVLTGFLLAISSIVVWSIQIS